MKQTQRNFLILVILAVATFCTGCGKREKEEPTESPTPSKQEKTPAKTESSTPASSPPVSMPVAPPTSTSSTDLAKIAAQNVEALKAASQGQQIEPISAQTLKGYLPASLVGMARGEAEAQDVDMMGIKVAEARAEYQAASSSGQLELTIADLGNLSGVMRMGMTAWAATKIDEQTDTGYQKSVTYEDYKGMEEYDRQAREGAFHLFVADRFLVKINGTGTTMEILKQAMGQIDLKKLAQAAN
jgi:hypothetical protein